MDNVKQVDRDSVARLLRSVSSNRASDVDALLDALAPVFEIDTQCENNLFWARPGNPSRIRMGLKCSVRLQAHAFASGVIFTAIGSAGFKSMSKPERDRLLEPADLFLRWGVGVDLTRWLQSKGMNPNPGLYATDDQVPHELIESLNDNQRTFGYGFFRYATAWIILHELAHLKLDHRVEEGYWSLQQEKAADQFAAEWLLDSASSSSDVESDRLLALFGIAIALLWITVSNVFFGPKDSVTHPQAYDRLSQVLDNVIDTSAKNESDAVWYFVAQMLFIHMWAAGYDFDQSDALHMKGDYRAEVNHLIDRISKFDRKRN